ncbi:MAG: DegV family protein, partial [Candidatus Poribacteria bacterium]
HLGEETYRDYFDINLDEFYQRLRDTNLFPTTTQPSPQEFVETYRRLSAEDDCLISIHLSSKLSGTYQSAMVAAQQLPEVKIHLIDSQQASLGLGMTVIAAAKAIEEKKEVNEVLSLINDIISQTKTYFSVDSLEYLRRGGRIGRAQAFVGAMLKIKPLLAIQDGEIVPVEKLRGRQRLIRRMVQLARDDATDIGTLRVGLIHADNEELLSMLSRQLAEIENLELEYTSKVGGIVTSHVGPGAIGVSYYPVV